MENVWSVMSRPALLASISYIILAFIVLLPLGVTEKGGPKYDIGKRILVVIVMLIPIALSIYSINCMVVGGCHVWAWIQGIAIAFWVLLFLVTVLISKDEQKLNSLPALI